MHLHFATNFGFDNIYPKFVNQDKPTAHGEIYRGQKGLLELLEEHLGLFDSDINDAIRIRQYQKAIEDALKENSNLYIAESFKADDWGSAKKLLQWRDELQLALWDFQCLDPNAQRLYTLAQIEGFTHKLSKGVNDRWRQIVERIKIIKKLPFSKITIYQPNKFLPPFFTHLFNLIEQNGVDVLWRETNQTISNTTNLDTLKQRLLNGGTGKVPLADDNSIIILEADNEKMAAHALSEYLIHKGSRPLLLIPDRGRILEQAIVSRGGSALGYAGIEEDSSLDQLMSLISLFIWQPINAERLIQFFSLPIAPLPKSLRNKLAEAYADKPGIENDRWNETLERYYSAREKREGYSRPKVEAMYENWFGRKKYSPKDGAPIAELIQLYKDLKKWASHLAASIENEIRNDALYTLSSRCDTLIDILDFDQAQGISTLSMLLLNKYVDEIGTGTLARNHEAEIGAYDFVTHPSHVTAPVDVLVWWNFVDTGNPLSNHPAWTHEELAILNESYIHEADKIIDLWYWELKQVVLNTTRQLVLVVPQSQVGEEVEPHLMMNDVLSTFKNVLSVKSQVDLDQNKVAIDDIEISFVANEEKKLPTKSISWNLGEDFKFEPREQESYSSLSKLFFYPAEYLLHYILKIRSIDIPKVNISPLIKGKIAHDTAEQLWSDPKILSYDDDSLADVIVTTLKEKIAKEGAIFLLKKNKISYDEFINLATKGLHTLFKSVRKNGWALSAVEQAYSYKDDNISIGGRIDLVLQRNDNELAVVDLKWGGRSSKMTELLSEEELQLVIYDKLLAGEQQKKIYLNYYIISEEKFISRTNEAFAESIVIPATEPGHHIEFLWNKVVATYKKRMLELKKGKIEVGNGLLVNDLQEQFDIWKEASGLLTPPVEGTKAKKSKRSNFYSKYNNLIGS